MKTIIVTILIGIALVFLSSGCGEVVNGVNEQGMYDGSSKNSFMFEQEYGFCDTACIAETHILGDYILPYVQECYVRKINTGDTVSNNLFSTSFKFRYSTTNPVTVNFGNGISKSYNGTGIDTIKYFCNKTYEVIICYD